LYHACIAFPETKLSDVSDELASVFSECKRLFKQSERDLHVQSGTAVPEAAELSKFDALLLLQCGAEIDGKQMKVEFTRKSRTKIKRRFLFDYINRSFLGSMYACMAGPPIG